MALDGNSNPPCARRIPDPAYVQSALILETSEDTGTFETVGIQSDLTVPTAKTLFAWPLM